MLRPVTLLFACSALLFALASDAAAQDDTPTRPSGTPSLVPPQGERVAYPIEIVADESGLPVGLSRTTPRTTVEQPTKTSGASANGRRCREGWGIGITKNSFV